MDLTSRVLIFFTFMIVQDNGNISPMRILTSFYTLVVIMFIFNIVFFKRRNFCSNGYWFEVLLNSYSSTLSLNQVDIDRFLNFGKSRSRNHQSSFVKQLCYYIIVFIIQISLTLVTLLNTPLEGITMVDKYGRTYIFTTSIVAITLAIGWAAFVLAMILNLLYYVLHPSQVNVKSFQEKRVVNLFGYEIRLSCSGRKKGNEEVEEKDEKADENYNENEAENDEVADEEVDLLQMRPMAFPTVSGNDDLEEVITNDNRDF